MLSVLSDTIVNPISTGSTQTARKKFTQRVYFHLTRLKLVKGLKLLMLMSFIPPFSCKN